MLGSYLLFFSESSGHRHRTLLFLARHLAFCWREQPRDWKEKDSLLRAQLILAEFLSLGTRAVADLSLVGALLHFPFCFLQDINKPLFKWSTLSHLDYSEINGLWGN
jgi:hypothetical protein